MTPLFLGAALAAVLGVVEPLKPIGEGRTAAGACGNLLVHANAAIAAALRNDAVLERAAGRLRAIDFESNELVRRNALNEFERVAADVHTDGTHGQDELKRLRELSEKSGSKDERGEAGAFEDALQNALDRQTRMAADLSALMGSIEAYQLRSETAVSAPRNWSAAQAGFAPPPKTQTPGPYSGTPNEMATEASVDFTSRMNDVAGDEAKAAAHSEAAVSGC
jgi:hypothetical protein